MKRRVTPGRVGIGVVVVVASWYGMMATHELGHVAGAVVTGGIVQRVEFPLVGFSRTVVEPSPRPMVEVWMGPIVGAVLPMVMMIVCGQRGVMRAIVRFFAGFCLIANGAYLGVGVFLRAGDAGDLVMLGAASWMLVVVGALAMSAGLWMWHRATANDTERAGV